MEREENGRNITPSNRRPVKRYEENIEIVSTYPAADRDEVDPYTYLNVIWRHRKIGLIFFAVVLATALLVSLFTKPMYYATSTVEVALRKPQVIGFQDVLEVDAQDPVFFNTQRDLIQSRAMAEAVIEKFDLWDHPDLNTTQRDLNPILILFSYLKKLVKTIEKPIRSTFTEAKYSGSELEEKDREKIKRDNVINTFLSRVEVLPSEDSRLITIGFEAYSPKFAAKMADAIANTFVEWSLDRGLEANRQAREFLKEQIAEVKTDLKGAELTLHQFLVKNGIVGFEKDLNLIYRQLEELNTALAETATEKTTKRSLYELVDSGNPDAILEVINDPLVQQLKSKYNELLVEYNNLSSVFKSEYPPLKRLQAQISGMREQINGEIARRVTGIKSDYEAIVKKEELLKKRAEEQQGLAMTLNQKTIAYRELEREVETSRSIYESLLQRFKETDVSGGIKTSSVQIVDHAAIPMAPFEPNTPRNLALAVLAGLIGAVGIAFLREFFDRTIKTPEEVREQMRLPVLGGILKLAENRHYTKLDTPIEKLYLSDPRSPFAEAIRTLRASIMLSSQDSPVRSMLVTSCWPGEGKTTVATNLALSLAYDQNRVLLIEADLRHPGVGKLFDVDRGKPGLSNYLMFNSELNEIIHSTYVPQLFVLPSGSIVPSTPSELLQSEAMKKLLERLKDRFDYVVIDSSPAIGLADSLMLSTVVDGTVLVSSVGITMQRDISHIVKRLSDINAPFLGVVVNRLELGREAYFYDRYYKSYYVGKAGEKTIEVNKNVRPSQPRLERREDRENPDEKGDLKDTPYPKLLLSSNRRKRTGVLSIDSDLKLRIYLQEGSPVFVEGGTKNTLLGNIVLAEGGIEREELERALDEVVRTRKKVGEVLIGMGLISYHELDRLLEYQVSEKLISGFRCASGTYSFKPLNDFVGGILTYKINPFYVIYEGVKRHTDTEEIERQFAALKKSNGLPRRKGDESLNEPELFAGREEVAGQGLGNLKGLSITPVFDITEKLRNMNFGPSEFRFLKSLRENQGVEDILSNNRLGREDTLRLLYFLNLVGLVEVSVGNPESGNDGSHDFNEFSSPRG